MESYALPDDVQYDERLFESNNLLRQYWQTSIQTRSEPAELIHQRAAEEDDIRSHAMGLYDSLVQEHIQAKMPQAAKDDLENVLKAIEAEVDEVSEEEPLVVEPLGPVMQPLATTGVPWWYWLIFGLVVGLLFLIMFGGRFWPFFSAQAPLIPAVDLPVRASFDF
jgi:hypothetical protein